MDVKEKRKQYYINNRDKLLTYSKNIIMIIQKRNENTIKNIGH